MEKFSIVGFGQAGSYVACLAYKTLSFYVKEDLFQSHFSIYSYLGSEFDSSTDISIVKPQIIFKDGTDRNIVRGMALLRNNKDKFIESISGIKDSIVLAVVASGGGSGVAMCDEAIKYLLKQNNQVIVLTFIPDAFEGNACGNSIVFLNELIANYTNKIAIVPVFIKSTYYLNADLEMISYMQYITLPFIFMTNSGIRSINTLDRNELYNSLKGANFVSIANSATPPKICDISNLRTIVYYMMYTKEYADKVGINDRNDQVTKTFKQLSNKYKKLVKYGECGIGYTNINPTAIPEIKRQYENVNVFIFTNVNYKEKIIINKQKVMELKNALSSTTTDIVLDETKESDKKVKKDVYNSLTF